MKLPQIKNDKLVACICVENRKNEAVISLFAVHPDFQGSGMGRQVLQQAENFIRNILQLKQVLIAVISQRPELIAYYERRGYIRTGLIEDFPVHLDVGTAKVDNLSIEYFSKAL